MLVYAGPGVPTYTWFVPTPRPISAHYREHDHRYADPHLRASLKLTHAADHHFKTQRMQRSTSSVSIRHSIYSLDPLAIPTDIARLYLRSPNSPSLS